MKNLLKSLIGFFSLSAFSFSLTPVAKAEVSGIIFCEQYGLVTQHIAISNSYFMALCTDTEEYQPTFYYLGGLRSNLESHTLLEAEIYTMHDASMSASNLDYTYEFLDECFTKGLVSCDQYKPPTLNIYYKGALIDSELMHAEWNRQ